VWSCRHGQQTPIPLLSEDVRFAFLFGKPLAKAIGVTPTHPRSHSDSQPDFLELQTQIGIGEPTEQRQAEHKIGCFLLAIVQGEPKLQARHCGAGCV